jgi:hypothetical protein
MIFTFGMKPASYSESLDLDTSDSGATLELNSNGRVSVLLSNLAASSLAVLGLVLWAASNLAWTAEPAGKFTIKVASIAVTFSHTILGVFS